MNLLKKLGMGVFELFGQRIANIVKEVTNDKKKKKEMGKDVLDNDGYVLMKQREHERIAFSIEKQQQQTKREVIVNKNNQMKITTRKSTPTTKRKSAIKIDSFVLSTLNSRENKEKLEKKKGINKEKNKCYEALHNLNESIKKIRYGCF